MSIISYTIYAEVFVIVVDVFSSRFTEPTCDRTLE